ncbi:MAG: SEC-C domain-containing protein [Chloroflexi bacterium]|nr:SEC-C domain-containing protein [Chloroflexota bacterium]
MKDLKDLQQRGRPVLAGTTSVEKSEQLSEMLTRAGVTHQVLNAKHHEREAGIVAQAGRIGTITVATNMAGRGTDIILGGNPEGRDPDAWAEEHKKVVELGGLHIIGTDRHEARRIDNQLRGRAGRQGDPGSSRFYISVEDDLMRRFGGDRIKTIMNWAGLSDDVPIEHSWISKSVESAQKKVEGFNFDTRKRLVEYDDVTNNHRDVIYTQRRKILEGSDIKANIQEMIEGVISEAVYSYLQDDHGDEWDLEGLLSAIRVLFSLPSDMNEERLAQMHRSEVEDLLLRHAETLYKAQEEKLGEQNMRSIERFVMLRTIDTHWVDHLTAMENMRQSIGLEAFGQRDPLVVYKRQSHEMYEELTTRIRNGIVRTIFHVSLEKKGNGQQPIDGRGKGPEARIAAESSRVVSESKENKDRGRAREKVLAGKVGRNDPCPCGSGKKYKKCHGV